MPLPGLTLRTQIAEAAAAAGLMPTQSQYEQIDLLAQGFGDMDNAGHVAVDGLEPRAFVARELARMPVARIAQPEPEPEAIPVGASLKAGALSFADLFKRSHAAETAREVATWPNPWRKGAENRTRQAIVTNTNPDLAAKLRADAGVAQ